MKYPHPNHITIFRLLLTFVALSFVFLENRLFSALAISIIFPLDAVDGYIARKTRTNTAAGAKLDSVGDYIGGIALLYLFYQFAPKMFNEYLAITLFPLAIFGLYIIFCFYFQKKFIPLHNYSAKFSVIIIFLFSEYLLWKNFSFIFYSIAIAFLSLNFLEKILIVITIKNPHPDTPSIFVVKKPS